MWSAQDASDFPSRTETFCHKNPSGSGYELVETAYIYYLFRLSKAWRFVLVNAVFGGWVGDCRNCIFSKTIKTFCHNNMPGSEHDSVENSYLNHLCWILKVWRFGLGNVELLATGYFDDLCWVSRVWLFGLVNAVFRGLLGDCRNFIFRKTIETCCRNNFPG